MFGREGVVGGGAHDSAAPSARGARPGPSSRPGPPVVLSGPSSLTGLVEALAALDPAGDDAGRVEQVALLERVKGACAAAQARVALALDDARRADEERRGVPARERGRGVAAEVALARRDSPARGSRHLGLARALADELPRTRAALTSGTISEWRATLVCRETAWLSVEHRREVDARVAPRLPHLGDLALERAVRALAQELDAAGAVDRARSVRADRRVTLRPAPDTMTYLSAHLPVEQGVAAFAALDAAARGAAARGDARTRGQLLADTLVERLTGQVRADAVPLEVALVMTDRALVGTDVGGATPARLPGHGSLPAPLARDLVAGGGLDGCEGPERWLRRLWADPGSGALVAAESRRRRFDGALRALVLLRDDGCRTPWCDAPVRHVDHTEPVRAGGRTSAANAAGVCARCNATKEAPGWRAEVVSELPHTRRITTPTGHVYDSTPPPLPGRGADSRPAATEPPPPPTPGHPPRATGPDPHGGPPASGPRSGRPRGRASPVESRYRELLAS